MCQTQLAFKKVVVIVVVIVLVVVVVVVVVYISFLSGKGRKKRGDYILV